MAGVLGVTEFERGVTERTTNGIGNTGFRHRRVEYLCDLATRIARVRGDGCVPAFPVFGNLRAQTFGDPFILRHAAAIETHLVVAGTAGDRVDADRPADLALEQPARSPAADIANTPPPFRTARGVGR